MSDDQTVPESLQPLTAATAVYFPAPRNLGWECPKCGGCYAPSVTECARCAPQQPLAWQLPQLPDPTQTAPPLPPYIRLDRNWKLSFR